MTKSFNISIKKENRTKTEFKIKKKGNWSKLDEIYAIIGSAKTR